MERNKIIAVAVLAIGIVAWRMGAMEQESGKKRDTGEMSKNIDGERSTKAGSDFKVHTRGRYSSRND